MSASSADIFTAMVQDSHVTLVFGYRTMGAGDSPEQDFIGVYSEGMALVTRSLVVCPQPVVTPEYATAAYVENVGVRNFGAAFVSDFTSAAVKMVKGN